MDLDDVINPYGTGYKTVERTVERSGTEQTDPSKNRVFKITNPNKLNPVSLNPVAYKLVPVASQMLLAHPDSWHARRADFCHAPIWVTKYKVSLASGSAM
jgi:primary-amine oxidase